MVSDARFVLRDGLVWDGTGRPPYRADVAIAGGRITDIASSLEGEKKIDCSGQTLIPGLIDCHVHVLNHTLDTAKRLQTPFSYPFFTGARYLEAMRRQGITHARDAAGADLGVKQALVDGLIDGPRLQIAITMIGQTGGHSDGWTASGSCVENRVPHPGLPSGVVDGPDEMRRKVREVIRAGADVIKVAASGGVLSPRDNPRHAHLSVEELQVAVAEARAAEIGVMAHAQSTQGIKNAIRAGVRSIEHGVFLDDEAIELMVSAGTYLVPTLLAPVSDLAAFENGARMSDAAVQKLHDVMAAHIDSFKRAARAGVLLAMGTDAVGFGPGHNLEELDLMHMHGLEPDRVLRASTLDAAKLLGVEQDYGSLEVGKAADLVRLNGERMDFAQMDDRIHSVYMDGKLVESR